MKLRSVFFLFGFVLCAAILGMVTFVLISENKVRIGGSTYATIIEGQGLTNDIKPPSAYILEAFQQATLEINGVQSVEMSRAKLAQLRKIYEERIAFWKKSNLDPGIKMMLTLQSDRFVGQFWKAVEEMHKGLEKNDAILAHQGYDDATIAFSSHRRVIQNILKQAKELNAKLEADSQQLNKFTNITIAAAVVGLFLVIGLGLYVMNRRMLKPVYKLTSVMQAMSEGDLEAEVPDTGRTDEIGEMARALLVFRDAALENRRLQEQAEAERAIAEQERARSMEAQAAAAEQQRAAEEERARNMEAQAAMAEQEKLAAEEQRRNAEERRLQQEAQARLEAEAAAERERAALDLRRAAEEQAAAQAAAMAEQERVVALFADAIKKVAQGDLTARLPDELTGNYERIKIDFNQMVGQLEAAIRSIAAAAQEVASASVELSMSTTDLSQRTEEQAAGLEETTASMKEIADTVNRNAQNAQAASRSAAEARDMADRGSHVVEDAVKAMKRIENSSQEISDIIGLIDDIARQTNLLALNAAVEAARAGEAGRGFAVVAAEVRNLAQRSSEAAKRITGLIGNSTQQVEVGASLVSQTGQVLSEIVTAIRSVADVVAGIAATSQDQAGSIAELNHALAQMDEAVQKNAALVEENASTAKMLEHQARTMTDETAAFRVGQGGANYAHGGYEDEDGYGRAVA